MHGDLKAGNVCLVSANAAAAAAAAVGDAAGGGASSAALCNGTTDACRDSNGSNAHGFDYMCKVRSSSGWIEFRLHDSCHACMRFYYVCKVRSSRAVKSGCTKYFAVDVCAELASTVCLQANMAQHFQVLL
jgi:hypothetical protein